MPHCPRCAAYISHRDPFCSSCGLQLAAGAPQPATAEVSRGSNGLVSGGGSIAAVGSVLMLIQNLMIVLGLVIIARSRFRIAMLSLKKHGSTA